MFTHICEKWNSEQKKQFDNSVAQFLCFLISSDIYRVILEDNGASSADGNKWVRVERARLLPWQQGHGFHVTGTWEFGEVVKQKVYSQID